jgi:hypothetical protein
MKHNAGIQSIPQFPHLTPASHLTTLRLNPPSPLSLIHTNNLHLLATLTPSIESISHPLPDQSSRKLDADDALPETQDLGVVGEHGALDAEAVVGGDGADAGDFVGGDSDAEAGAADENGAVCFAGCNLGGGVSGGHGSGVCGVKGYGENKA